MKVSRLIKHAYFLFSSHINAKLKDYDLTMSQLDIIIKVLVAKDHGEILNQRDLERALNISNPTVTGLIDRLEKKGLMERVQCSEDKRVKYLSVTEKGKALADEVKVFFERNDEVMLDGFSDEEKQQLNDYLSRILENMKKEEL